MKAVMYHYVRKFNNRFPYFKNLDVEDFEKQLNYFEEVYGFVSRDEFVLCLQTGFVPKGVILTFDDGLKDHFRYVLPVLMKKKLWGIFYVPTMIYQNREYLDVHKIHLLLGRQRSATLYARLMELIDDSMLTHGSVKEFKELTYTEQVNDDLTMMIKRTLNYYIGYAYRHQILEALMNEFLPEGKDLFDSFYLSPNELKIMQAKGMVIGSHTISHPVMSKLSLAEQKEEVENSFSLLENFLGRPEIKTFCYPYGGFHSFTKETEDLLTANQCLFSFNVEHRDIGQDDLLYRPQALPRYDCNYFPYGECRPVNSVGNISVEV
jgi:peptidoglycan/xylan/chitin deacetylase (PgdA/CDA1 family)